MERRVALDHHGAADDFFDLLQVVVAIGFQDLGDLRVDAQQHVVAVDHPGHLLGLHEDFANHRLDALNVAGAFANRARRAEGTLQGLLDAFAGDRHQAEIVERENLVRRPVYAHGLFEDLHHFLAVLALVHIDEVDHDDAAKVPQADLTDDLLDGVGVDPDNGVFEPVGLADVFAGVDVDCDQGLGLIDDNVSVRR